MKNKKAIILLLIFLLLPSRGVFASSVQVEVNNETVHFLDQEAIIENGRTLVPVRGVFEKLGFIVSWDEKNSIVGLENNEYSVRIGIGNDYFLVGNEKIALDVEAKLINGRTMLPLRAISEGIGADVSWNEKTNTASIQYAYKDTSWLDGKNYNKNRNVPDFGKITGKEGMESKMDGESTLGFTVFEYKNISREEVAFYEEILLSNGFLIDMASSYDLVAWTKFMTKDIEEVLTLYNSSDGIYQVAFEEKENIEEGITIKPTGDFYYGFYPKVLDYGYLHKDYLYSGEYSYTDKGEMICNFTYLNGTEEKLNTYKEKLVSQGFSLIDKSLVEDIEMNNSTDFIAYYIEDGKTYQVLGNMLDYGIVNILVTAFNE